MNDYLNRVICGDALEILPKFDPKSIDIVLTDPPYFLDKMDNNWDHEKVSSNKYQHAVKSLPPGMKFDREQGKRFYKWFHKVSLEVHRVLKPGGFFFSFSSPRLYHRMACAVDDAGLLIKDCFIWLYTQNQVKAMSINHFIDKMDASDELKNELKERFAGWKTPQIKSCFEPILMAQKQPDGTFLNNMRKHKIGLLNTNIKIGKNMYPANVMMIDNIDEAIDKYFLIGKPDKSEKKGFNHHRTVKPLKICQYIIELCAFSPEAIVLDPFAGSGTTLVAAKNLNKNFIGIDINQEYVNLAEKRLGMLTDNEKTLSNRQDINTVLPIFNR
ncbi:site-specific DNA-methyltransferase [bacterium]|nr:site-specific DNA-methyltransferase [bacterium]